MPLTTKFMLPVRVMFSKKSTRQSSLSSNMITGDFEWTPVFDTTVSYEAWKVVRMVMDTKMIE